MYLLYIPNTGASIASSSVLSSVTSYVSPISQGK